MNAQKKPETYNTYGCTTHSQIAEELQISTSLSAHIEDNIFLKFVLGMFNPPWSVRELCFRRLKDADGNRLCFDVGECSDLLADWVRSTGSVDIGVFKQTYERKMVLISRHPMFRRFVLGVLRPEDPESEYVITDSTSEEEHQTLNFIAAK